MIFSMLYMVLLIGSLLKNEEFGVKVIVYTMLAIPYSTFNNILEKLTLIEIHGFSINLPIIACIVFFVYEIFRYKKFLITQSACLILLFGILCCFGFLGSNEYLSGVKDFYKFGIQIIWGLAFCIHTSYSNKFELDKWQNTCFNAMVIACLIFVLGRFFDWTFIYDTTKSDANLEEVGMWLSNCLIVVFGYFGFELMENNNRIFRYKILIKLLVCSAYMTVFQKSRIALAAAFMAFFAGIFFSVFSEKKIRYLRRNIVILCGIVLGVIIAFVITLNLNINVINRLLATKLSSSDDTLLTRTNTIVYYTDKILRRPLRGYGFGNYLPLINQYGRFHGSNSYYTDNALINVGMKAGLLAAIMYLLIWIIPVIKCLKNKKSCARVRNMGITFFLFFIAVAIFTSQVNHNYVVNFYAISTAVIMLNIGIVKGKRCAY